MTMTSPQTDSLLIIDRIYRDTGTFGWMSINGVQVYTIEAPWLGNQAFQSCIPEGNYVCKPSYYDRGAYDAIEICDVPNRTDCLFHKANYPDEVVGCIAPNWELIFSHAGGHGKFSRQAFDLLMEFLKEHGQFDLLIRGFNSPPDAVWV